MVDSKDLQWNCVHSPKVIKHKIVFRLRKGIQNH